jgi:hypothetical protein
VAQSNLNLRIENNLIISGSSIEEIEGGSCRFFKLAFETKWNIQFQRGIVQVLFE